jgi:hypothetical protein
MAMMTWLAPLYPHDDNQENLGAPSFAPAVGAKGGSQSINSHDASDDRTASAPVPTGGPEVIAANLKRELPVIPRSTLGRRVQ